MSRAPEYTIEQLGEIAKRVSTHLRESSLGKWQVAEDPYNNRAAWLRRGEFALVLSQVVHGPNEGRITIRGEYGKHGSLEKYKRDDIRLPVRTFRHDREHEKIAHEIDSVFLPLYYDVYAELKARKIEHDEEVERTVAHARLLAEASGGLLKLPPDFAKTEIRFSASSRHSGFYLREVYVSCSDRAYMHLNGLPVRVATKILAILADYESEGAPAESEDCDHPFTYGAVCLSCGDVIGGYTEQSISQEQGN